MALSCCVQGFSYLFDVSARGLFNLGNLDSVCKKIAKNVIFSILKRVKLILGQIEAEWLPASP